MQILIVSQYFWPENFRINDLASELSARGHSITVLTGVPNYPQGKFYSGFGLFSPFKQDFEGVQIFRAPIFPRGNNSSWKLALNYLSFAFFGSLIGLLFFRKRYDAIFVFEVSPITVGIPAIAVKMLTRSPIFFWVQDLWPDSLTSVQAVSSRMILRIIDLLVRFIYNRCHKILVSSESFIEKIIKQRQKKDKIIFFPQWTEELFQVVSVDDEAPERNDIPPGFCIMFAGNLGFAQSFETIIDAAEKLKKYNDIKWVIIGDGRMKDWIGKEIINRNLQHSVYLIGSKPLHTMPTYFALADALLVSLRKSEINAMTIPAKIQSYLACGKPIIASLDGEGQRIIERSQSGLTSGSGDAEGLAENVNKLYQMASKERKLMGTRGKQYSEKFFNRTKLIDRLEDYFAGH